MLYREQTLIGCFSSPPSSWQKALDVEHEEAHNLQQLITHILPIESWRDGFGMMRTGEAVKILVDMEG
jgi:threonine dehydrogenase-like Zn-dependent dehydrogenase